MIISGKYEGNYIVLNEEFVSFVSNDPVKLNKNTLVSTMYKEDVKSITKESEHASGDKERVAFWLGSIVAAGMSESKIFVIRIVWQDGQESLANITDKQYQYVLATQMKSNPTGQKQDEKIRVVWDKESVYNNAIALFNKNTYASDQAAMKEFQSVIDYKDARIYITKLRSRIEKHKTNAPQIVAEGRKALNTILVIVMVISAILAIVGFCVDLPIVGVLFAIIFVCVLLIFIAFANTAPKKFQNNKKKK